MSEQQESPENLDDGIRTFEMRVTVPGEPGQYEVKLATSQEHLDVAIFDLPDHVIMELARQVCEHRRRRLWGNCAIVDCKRSRTKTRNKCEAHAWEEDRSKQVTHVGPQYPSAL